MALGDAPLGYPRQPLTPANQQLLQHTCGTYSHVGMGVGGGWGGGPGAGWGRRRAERGAHGAFHIIQPVDVTVLQVKVPYSFVRLLLLQVHVTLG